MRIFVKIGLLIVFPVISFSSFAKIEWLEKNLEIGAIYEAEGPREGSFRFVNKGETPVNINDIIATCGCTAVSRRIEPVLPGDTAHIVFSFNPAGRPGKFDKNLRVFISGEDSPQRLSFSGIVLASEETLDKRFPVKVGSLRLETDHLKLGELTKGSRRHSFISIYNNGTDTIAPTFSSPAKGIELNLVPKTVAPGETASLSLYIKTQEIDGDGFRELPVIMKTVSEEGREELSAQLEVSLIIFP